MTRIGQNRIRPLECCHAAIIFFVVWYVFNNDDGAYASPTVPTNILTQAVSLFQAGRFDDACRVCDELIRRGGQYEDIQEALYRKGKCLQAMNQYLSAIDCWENMLGRYANTEWDDEVLWETGKICVINLNQPDTAILSYERLIRNYPRSKRIMEAQYYLGVAAYIKGDYRKAKRSFEVALAKSPSGGLVREVQEWLNHTTTMALTSSVPSRAGESMSTAIPPREKTPESRSVLAANVTATNLPRRPIYVWKTAQRDAGPTKAPPSAATNAHTFSSPTAPTNVLTQAVSLFQAGRFDDACRVCDELIRRGGKYQDIQEALYQKGKCLLIHAPILTKFYISLSGL